VLRTVSPACSRALIIAMSCLALVSCDDGVSLSAEGLRYEQQVPLPSRNLHRSWPGFAVGNDSIVVADVPHPQCSQYSGGTEDCGVSIIERSDAAWKQTDFFEDPALGAIESLATNGETVVVGHVFPFSSQAVFYDRVGSEWTATFELSTSRANAIAIERDTAVVAEVDRSGESVLGKLTFLERQGGGWGEAQVLHTSDTVFRFGGFDSIDLEDDTLVVGDFERDRAHVFERIDGQWEETAVLTSPNPEQDRGSFFAFGFDVATSGNRVAVGAGGEEPPAVYVFERGPDSSWGLSARVLASNAHEHHKPGQPVVNAFGESVALHGDLLLVGARGEGSFAVGINNPIPPTQADTTTGAAYLFEHLDGAWEERYYIKVPDSYKLGTRVALDDERLWVAGLDSVHVWVHGQP